MRSHTALCLPLGFGLFLSGCVEDTAAPPEEIEELGVATSAITVADAIDTSCATSSVKGLSLQIIAKAACIEPNAYTEVPLLPNVTFVDTVFPFLEAPARDAFVAAVQEHPNTSLTVNSMLRTVAQQVLLYEWYQTGRCGIGLAATPGNSNHETGLAMDVSQYNTWKPYFQAHGFTWLGANDPVHFDYTGPGATSYKGVDVLAFQMLWNENHPEDPITEDGSYGPQTKARILAAPADGFPGEVMCDMPTPSAPALTLAASFSDAADRFSDGSSIMVPDLFVGDGATATLEVANDGTLDAADVVLAVTIDPAFTATGLLVERSADGATWEPDATVVAPAAAQSFEVALGGLAIGEHKRLQVALGELSYSVEVDEPAAVRVWVKKLDDRYAQDSFGGTVTNDGSQTFGGGRLQLADAADVYARDHWEWNSDRREGLTAPESVALSVELGSLRAAGLSPGDVLALPEIDLSASSGRTIAIKGKRDGAGTIALVVAGQGATLDSTTEVLPLDWPADGADHEIQLELGTGVIHQLGLRADDANATLALDYVRLEDPSAGEGGAGGGGAGADDPGDACSCRAVGETRKDETAAPGWALLLGIAGAISARRGARGGRRGPGRTR